MMMLTRLKYGCALLFASPAMLGLYFSTYGSGWSVAWFGWSCLSGIAGVVLVISCMEDYE